ncbi:MAG: KpsF/GutQ family sugar-phosphate isomerase [Bacteroidales bacterium]|jgi:arabinose-5-phosphate isomerase
MMIATSEILSIARETLMIEGQAIIDISEQLGDSFPTMALRIRASKGRLILTGVGKSGHIAQKICATLNSIGTPSVFMHATDALHGDLGVIGASDLVLIISKSGNTSEIKTLVPLIRALGNPILAMVSDAGSYLESQSEITVRIPIQREACPINLAPTTSTTVQLAMGDALAMVLLKLNDFSSSDFARLHPGGLLGKRLSVTVSDLYQNNARPQVLLTDPVRKVIMEISSKRLGATAVTGTDGKITGIVTDGDLRRMMEKHEDLRSLTAADIMSGSPKLISPDELAVHALETMRTQSITQLLVVKDGEYLGVIHIHDILREGII